MTRTPTTEGPGTDPADQATGEAGRRDPATQRGDTRMVNVHTIDELAQRLAAMVPPGLKQAREDLTDNFRSALQSGLRELDLVTREEFDVQRCVLLRTREKIEELEQQVANLERAIGASAPRPSH
jgi:ubiquinone biosynthesis accessory factor UbiK